MTRKRRLLDCDSARARGVLCSPLAAFLVVASACKQQNKAPFYQPPAPSSEDAGQGQQDIPVVKIASVLDGLRWEMPCASTAIADYKCEPTNELFSSTAQLEGHKGETHRVTFRFRGVVEQESYAGGEQDGSWYQGGAPNDGNYNIYSFETSAPKAIYYLNAGKAGVHNCFAIDYEETILLEGGSTVTLAADAQDGALILNQDENGMPIVVADISPYPKPFNGQFIQMDVISEELVQ